MNQQDIEPVEGNHGEYVGTEVHREGFLTDAKVLHVHKRRIGNKAEHAGKGQTVGNDKAGAAPIDLRSRLGWGPVVALEELSQEQKRDWLQQRAGMRGFDISDEAADYLLRHYPRSMRFLSYALEELDRVTLQKQRKVTVPLLRQELSVPRAMDF